MHRMTSIHLRHGFGTTQQFIVLRVLGTTLDYAKGFLLPLLVYQQSGGSTVAAGLAYFVEFLPVAVLTPMFGSMVDRSEGKRLVYAVEAGRFLIIALWALIAYSSSAWLLSSAVSLCSGLCLLFYEATATQQLSHDQLHKYQTVTQLLEPFARLVGPAAIGIMVLAMSPERIVAVLAAGYLFAFALSVFWRHTTRRIERAVTLRWSLRLEMENFKTLAFNGKLLALTIATGFLNAYFGVFQSLLVPTMVGYYKVSSSLSAIPNIVGGLFSLLIALVLPRFAGKLSLTRYALMGAGSLLASALLAASGGGPAFFSVAFGFLILASALYGIFFRAKRIELIRPSQLAQGIGATGSLLMLFLPLSGLVTIGSNALSPLLVIGASGIVASVSVVVGMASIGALGVAASPIAQEKSGK